MKNRDMVAFTVGLVALSLMRDGWPVSDTAILDRLNDIADGGVGNRITPFMAESALYALRDLRGSGAPTVRLRADGRSATTYNNFTD
ncbi:hypothetical protein E2979_08230 [Paracoccus yeei]